MQQAEDRQHLPFLFDTKYNEKMQGNSLHGAKYCVYKAVNLCRFSFNYILYIGLQKKFKNYVKIEFLNHADDLLFHYPSPISLNICG